MRISVAITLFFFVCFFSWKVWEDEQVKRALKADQVELSHVKYGLFNVDQWKQIAVDIVSRKVDEFEITADNREEVLKKTEDLLYEVLDEVEEVLREENRKSLGGFFKQLASDLFVPFDDVRKGVPRYAETIVDRLNDPQTKSDIKDFVREKVDEAADGTVGTMDYQLFNMLLERYESRSQEEALGKISAMRQTVRERQRPFIIGLGVSVFLMLLMVATGARSRAERMGFTLTAFVLLAGGVTLPMIDIEATITQFSFLLAGEPVMFEDQVLFFQSKSILEVIGVLITEGDPPLVVVSFLILSFSVLLPMTKIALTLSAQYSGEEKHTRGVIYWLLYRSGKWSMADVMVVALFMAYIGFSGVINSQLTQIERNTGTLEIFTTNNSTLQLGFYLFTAYALCGILLSSTLKRRMTPDA
jgi:hypothetical protein